MRTWRKMKAEVGTWCSSISMLKVKIIILKILLTKEHYNLINSFRANDLILYPLKTSKNLWFTDVLLGFHRKRPVAKNGLIESFGLQVENEKIAYMGFKSRRIV